MKKVLALILIVLMLVLSGCERENDEIPPFVIKGYSRYEYVYNIQSSVIVCVVVSEPIWDEYYTMYGDGYEYEFYGDEIDYIFISYEGTLMIEFYTGEVTYIYNYIAITFDV